MGTRYLSPSQRREVAGQAIAALGADRRNHVLLRVRCSANHHVATVFRTDAGPVFVSVVGQRAHGNRDFVDLSHGVRRCGNEYVDLLNGAWHADDGLPAHCECGAHFLSRRELRQTIDSAQRTFLIQ